MLERAHRWATRWRAGVWDVWSPLFRTYACVWLVVLTWCVVLGEWGWVFVLMIFLFPNPPMSYIYKCTYSSDNE